MSNNRYIELDSTYRNRIEFPHPAQFEVNLAQGSYTTAVTALDPVLNAFPYYPAPGAPAVTFAGGVAAAPILDANTSITTNAYIGDYIEDVTLGQFRQVTFYDGTTQTATLTSAFVGWAAADNYRIRSGLPSETGALVAGTINTVTLPVTSSATDGFYIGQYIWITSGAATGDVRRITGYVGATRIATVAPHFSAAPAVADTYEILNFTRDNVVPLSYSGSTVSQEQTVCYEIELISLILPNVDLYVKPGGLPSLLPYVYVEFTNLSAPNPHGKNIIYSNNPNAGRALFKAAIDDVPTPIISKFIKIDSDGMVQTVKFKPNDNLRFSVYLPDGQLFTTAPDNFSPLEPNEELQISATFAVKRL